MSTTGPVVVRPPEARLPRRLDRYELIGEIARGGMGTVLLARLAGAGGFSRLFAIKLLHPHLAADEQFVHMLLDEARLAARIHHSNAVPIVDVCQSEIGLYVVMDYVEGFTFNKILGAPALDHQARIRIGVQALVGVLGGLDAAHNLTDDDGTPFGLVHRDVSPSNVLIGIDGVGRIADFGIAHAGARITHTEPGLVKGKVAYMAPEQARGDPLDRRADVWGVGVMLWECLTGKRLFKSNTDAATVLRLIKEPIPLPSSVQPRAPLTLDAVCMKALDRDVAQRYASAHDMAADLSRAAERAGCLATNIEAADLLRARFGEEITGRQAAIRAYCATLSASAPGGETPARPEPAAPQRLHAVPAGPGLPALSVTPELPASEPAPPPASVSRQAVAAASSSSLLLEIAVDPPRPHPLRRRRVQLVIAGVLLGGALALLLLRAHARHTPATATPLPLPASAATQTAPPAPLPPAPPPPAPVPAATTANPAATLPPAVSPTPPMPAEATPAAAPAPAPPKRHHGTHGHGSARPEPALEMNPYLHR